MLIRKVKLFVNNNEKSKLAAQLLKTALTTSGYELVETACDLAIAVGGDGSFLSMVRKNSFDTGCYYIGVNTGTLGFLQELSTEDIDDFISYLNTKEYRYDYFDLQETTVVADNNQYEFTSLNEVVIRHVGLNALELKVLINGEFLESYVGDGLLVSTTIGSTAYNMSFGGSIVDFDLKTMQITPIAPLTNRKYHNLRNSLVVPTSKIITVIPNKKDLILTIDGENVDCTNVKEINIKVVDTKIKCLRFHTADISSRIASKLL